MNIEQSTVKIEAPRVTKKCTPLLQPGIRSHKEKTDLVFYERQSGPSETCRWLEKN